MCVCVCVDYVEAGAEEGGEGGKKRVQRGGVQAQEDAARVRHYSGFVSRPRDVAFMKTATAHGH